MENVLGLFKGGYTEVKELNPEETCSNKRNIQKLFRGSQKNIQGFTQKNASNFIAYIKTY